MDSYDVQITTELGEVVVLTVIANDSMEAEEIAISMVESGDAPCDGIMVEDCFAL